MPEIRELTKEYAEELAAIEKLCFTDAWSCESFIGCFNSSFVKVFGAFEDESLAGYIVAKNVLGEGELLNICILPEYRRNGLATALFEASGLNELDKVFLEVRVSNEPAKNMYKKLGFKEIGIRANYYQDNSEDAKIMELERG